MSENVSATEAVDFAKSTWPMEDGEPLIPSSAVQLRELCLALDYLLSTPLKEEEKWVDSTAYWHVLEALKEGTLVAKTFATDTVIPYYSWSSVDADNGKEAYDSNFWFGEISRDSECHGFTGQLPIIERIQAEDWLKNFTVGIAVNTSGVGEKSSVIRDPKELRHAFAQFISERSTAAERDRWGAKYAPGGRNRARELWAEMKPKDGSKSGPKGPRTGNSA